MLTITNAHKFRTKCLFKSMTLLTLLMLFYSHYSILLALGDADNYECQQLAREYSSGQGRWLSYGLVCFCFFKWVTNSAYKSVTNSTYESVNGCDGWLSYELVRFLLLQKSPTDIGLFSQQYVFLRKWVTNSAYQSITYSTHKSVNGCGGGLSHALVDFSFCKRALQI